MKKKSNRNPIPREQQYIQAIKFYSWHKFIQNIENHVPMQCASVCQWFICNLFVVVIPRSCYLCLGPHYLGMWMAHGLEKSTMQWHYKTVLYLLSRINVGHWLCGWLWFLGMCTLAAKPLDMFLLYSPQACVQPFCLGPLGLCDNSYQGNTSTKKPLSLWKWENMVIRYQNAIVWVKRTTWNQSFTTFEQG